MTRTVRALTSVAARAVALVAPGAAAAAFDDSAPLGRSGGGTFSDSLGFVGPSTPTQPKIDVCFHRLVTPEGSLPRRPTVIR